MRELRYIAIAGNVLFILWLLYNGIDKGFKATNAQLVSYVTLISLLILNIFIVWRKK